MRPLEEDSVTAANALLSVVRRYRDRASAIEWICRAFGFDLDLSVDDGGTIHARVQTGDATIVIGPLDIGGETDLKPKDGAGLRSYIATSEDVEVHCERARRAGAVIVIEPYETLYGSRQYVCRDPEGYLWSVRCSPCELVQG